LVVREAIQKHYQASAPDFDCRPFIDYRQMLTSTTTDIDAVLCATPDHLHAKVSVDSMRAGKHVYCEKPLTHSVDEARIVSKVAADTGVATQLGNQGHSKDTIRQTCERIWAGAIGTVKEVHAWVPATRWNQTLIHPPTETMVTPEGLNWDLWCGPREPVGFHTAYAPVAWRDFWSFGCGAMGDFGCHDLDSATWALDLGMPKRIEMQAAGQTDPNMTPYGEVGRFEFDNAMTAGKSGPRGPVTVHWYSGGLHPTKPDQMKPGDSLPRRGVMFVGSDGILVCQGAGGASKIYPEVRRRQFQEPEPTLKRVAGHHRDWIDAIKGGDPASSHFQYGAKLTEITLLGIVALRAGEPIDYDAAAMKITNVDDANRLLRQPYRDGWTLDA
ncbi:MAG: Gfo/Idh/MocA family oxidoreductase, partial [Planctomycetota bacterium]